MTNKQIFNQGKLVEHYPIDQNPFTGQQESNGGIENLLVYNGTVYSVLTDFTGSVADPDGLADIVSDDAETFMQQIFSFDDPEEVAKAEAEEQMRRDEDDAMAYYYWQQSQREDEWNTDMW